MFGCRDGCSEVSLPWAARSSKDMGGNAFSFYIPQDNICIVELLSYLGFLVVLTSLLREKASSCVHRGLPGLSVTAGSDP